MFRRGFLQALVSGVACACGPRPSGMTIAAPSAASVGRSPLSPLDARVFLARIDRVRALAHDAGAEWTFVSSGTTSFAYLTGASIERSERLIALLVPAAGDPVIVAPSFEVERVTRTVRLQASIHGWEESQSPFELVRAVASHGAVLVEPHGEYGTAMALSRTIPDARLIDGSAAFESLRVVKQAEELARIRRAVAITHDVFDRAFAALRPGVRDRDVSRAIASAFEREGYEGYALVQFGPLSALPHGPPAGDALASDVAVLIDGGCRVEGYWSDVTRTRWFGSSPPTEFRRVADVVAEAQRAGIDRARPGVEAQEIDRAARAVITKAGYGPYFTHRTGHGLGMDGHEPIYMVEGNRTPLVPGCVFTVEPGIYLPGRFGVRIEDDVVCDDAAARVIEGA